jgi:hypothetical protein
VKLEVTDLVKKFPAFYGTQRLITMFVRACHCFMPSCIHFNCEFPVCVIISLPVLILQKSANYYIINKHIDVLVIIRFVDC